jgi:5-formyltetrahydrofolate cyclo-ligase
VDPKAAKIELREAIKTRMARMKDAERAAESRSICRRILQNIPKDPSLIAAFYPLKDEVDIRPLLPELQKLGHRVFLPCVEKGKLAFRAMTSPELMKTGAFGVLEPPDSSPLLNEPLDVALIPGRAFDEKGNRMGRGNGGYDVWIRAQRSGNAKTRIIGIAFECQLTHEVPMEDHDETVDTVITARGLFERKG